MAKKCSSSSEFALNGIRCTVIRFLAKQRPDPRREGEEREKGGAGVGTAIAVPTLTLAKAVIGPKATCAGINPVLYAMEREGVLTRESDEGGVRPRWRLSDRWLISGASGEDPTTEATVSGNKKKKKTNKPRGRHKVRSRSAWTLPATEATIHADPGAAAVSASPFQVPLRGGRGSSSTDAYMVSSGAPQPSPTISHWRPHGMSAGRSALSSSPSYPSPRSPPPLPSTDGTAIHRFPWIAEDGRQRASGVAGSSSQDACGQECGRRCNLVSPSGEMRGGGGGGCETTEELQDVVNEEMLYRSIDDHFHAEVVQGEEEEERDI